MSEAEFVAWYLKQDERRQLEQKWQGSVVHHSLSYRDEAGNLAGEQQLEKLFAEHQKTLSRLGSVAGF